MSDGALNWEPEQNTSNLDNEPTEQGNTDFPVWNSEYSSGDQIDNGDDLTPSAAIITEPPSAPDVPPTTVTATKVRKKRTGGGSANILGWSDVGAIFDFAQKYEALSAEQRDLFTSVIDIDKNSDAIDVAQSLYPSGGDVAAFNVVKDIIAIGETDGGAVGFIEGIKLVTRIDNLADGVAKTIARQVSSITGADIKYRKNSQTTEFVSSVLSALDDAREVGGLGRLNEISELLEIWPGSKK